MDFIETSIAIAALCYFIATSTLLLKMFHPDGPNYVLVLFFACCAIIPHSLIVNELLIQPDNINFSLPNVVSLVSLIITLSITAVALKYKVNLLLPVTYGFACVWLVIANFIPVTPAIALSADKLIIITHITLALMAYCILIIGCLYVFQVSYINLKLKRKNLLAVNHLPPLMIVEKQLFFILALGTLCLLISEITGFIFLDDLFSKDRAHKTTLSLLSLAIYLSILWGHFKYGWRGHKVMVLTLIATTLLTLSYFGSRFVKEFLL